MKINDFTKADQLIMFINKLEISGNLFSLAEYGDQAIDYGIATTKKRLSNILSKLKKNGLIANNLYVDAFYNQLYCWQMTYLGQNYAHELMLKLDDNSWFSVQPKENKKVEQPNSFADDAQKYADIAKDIASKILKQYGVNTDTNEYAKLRDEINYLNHKLDEAKTIIENLRRTNRTIFEKLDKKTKECEKFQLGFDKLKDACQSLIVWIGDMKHGQGI